MSKWRGFPHVSSLPKGSSIPSIPKKISEEEIVDVAKANHYLEESGLKMVIEPI